MLNVTINVVDELEKFTPELRGWKSGVFLTASMLVSVITVVVQATIYKTLKRLGSRVINQIIIPSQLLFNLATPINLLNIIAKSIFYPLTDITGDAFCYFETYLLLWANMHSNFLTIFVTIFRYICIFHDDKLTKCELAPQTLGRIFVALQLVTSIALTIIVLQASPNSRSLDSCLGHYEIHFFQDSGHQVCSNGGAILGSLCSISVLFHIMLSSNIPEAFMLYSCFKEISAQDERAKEMIGEKHYTLRKRDNGIVINISVVQWIIEVINFIFYYTYIYFLHGLSNYSDKFFSLYLITFTMIIQPSFYLSGDAAFRRNLDNKGLFSALKIAIKSDVRQI